MLSTNIENAPCRVVGKRVSSASPCFGPGDREGEHQGIPSAVHADLGGFKPFVERKDAVCDDNSPVYIRTRALNEHMTA